MAVTKARAQKLEGAPGKLSWWWQGEAGLCIAADSESAPDAKRMIALDETQEAKLLTLLQSRADGRKLKQQS